MMVMDTIHDTFPLGQTGAYICVCDHVKKRVLFFAHQK